MIEFTILELTLGVLCIGLFIQVIYQSKKITALGYLVEAICRNEKVYKDIVRTIKEFEEIA